MTEKGKAHACPYELCFKSFDQRYKLTNHIKTHTKPHKCPECGKGFAQKSQIKHHMPVHTGEAIYGPCSICKRKLGWRCDFVNYTQYYKDIVKMGLREPLKEIVCFFCAAQNVRRPIDEKKKEELSKSKEEEMSEEVGKQVE